jgi:Protein of unknown function (DUF5818)
MSRGTRHTLTGTLRWTRFGYALEMDGGGMWRLDVSWGWKARRCVDQRVTIEGVRSGFDLLDVNRVETIAARVGQSDVTVLYKR